MAQASTVVSGTSIILEPQPNFDQDPFSRKIRDAKLWHLLVQEDAPTANLRQGDRIYGQFTPQDVSHQLGANVPEAGGFSRTNPLVQWVGGTVETLTFQARLFSEHSEDQTAAKKLAILKKLRESLPPMNRPPIMTFFWGQAFPGGIRCLVESLGGVKYDEIRPDGSLRGVTLSITLKKVTYHNFVRNVESPVEQTPLHTVREGETYEMIAYRQWGDPLLGVPLRRMNPRFPMERWAPSGLADLQPNEQIKMYDRSDLTKEFIKPENHLFNEDDQVAADIRRYYFQERGRLASFMPRK